MPEARGAWTSPTITYAATAITDDRDPDPLRTHRSTRALTGIRAA
jgi:hypothetical protein